MPPVSLSSVPLQHFLTKATEPNEILNKTYLPVFVSHLYFKLGWDSSTQPSDTQHHADATDPTTLGSTGMRLAGDEISALLH